MASQRSGSSSPSSGDYYNSETAGASCWSQRTWHLDDNLGLRAETLHLGAMLLATQDGRYEYARDKRPGLMVLHSASCHATLQRSRPKPQQPDVFGPRYASASLGTASVPFLVPPASMDLVLPASLQ